MDGSDSQRSRRRFLQDALRLAGGVAAMPLVGCATESSVPSDADVVRQGGLDTTFFFVADTHFGYVDDAGRDIESLNVRLVENLNRLAGRPWPSIYGGNVPDPWGVIVAGDLTEDGKPEEWALWEQYFGQVGERALQYPVYECPGNHDRHAGSHVESQILRRHGARRYVIDQGDLRIVNLGEFPDSDDIDWLRVQLAEAGRERPVIIYFHYALLGPYGHSDWLSKWKLLYAMNGYNVVGLFHGHFHASGMYRWYGYDVYNVGASKHGSNSFATIRVTDDRMTVAEWNWGMERWWWTHSKAINGTAGTEHLEVFPSPRGHRQPAIPYPKYRKHRG